jgi:hypothetical protein
MAAICGYAPKGAHHARRQEGTAHSAALGLILQPTSRNTRRRRRICSPCSLFFHRAISAMPAVFHSRFVASAEYLRLCST